MEKTFETFAIITLFPLPPPQGINIFFPRSGGCSVQTEALGHRNLKKSLLSAISDLQNLVWCVDVFTGMTKFTFGTRGLPINVRSIQLCCKTEIWGNPGYATCQKWSSDFFSSNLFICSEQIVLNCFLFPRTVRQSWHMAYKFSTLNRAYLTRSTEVQTEILVIVKRESHCPDSCQISPLSQWRESTSASRGWFTSSSGHLHLGNESPIPISLPLPYLLTVEPP